MSEIVTRKLHGVVEVFSMMQSGQR